MGIVGKQEAALYDQVHAGLGDGKHKVVRLFANLEHDLG